MMLNRFAAVGFPFGQTIFQATAPSFFNKLQPDKATALPLFALSEGAGAFMPLKPSPNRKGFSPGPFLAYR